MNINNSGVIVSNSLLTVIIAASLLVGIVTGYLGFIYLGHIAGHCQIKYVAEEEIMELERKRIEGEKLVPQKQDLFFGDIDKAVELTERLAQRQNDRKTKVIFSVSPVFAGGVESISEQIHKKVINELGGRRLDTDVKKSRIK